MTQNLTTIKKELKNCEEIDSIYDLTINDNIKFITLKGNEEYFYKGIYTKMGNNKIQSLLLNSIEDNKKFEINSVELLYSMPINSFTLISDEKNNIYLARIKDIQIQNANIDDKKFDEYSLKQNTNNKNSILKTYDLLLNSKYNVKMNQKTIERVKNFFQ